MKENFLAATTWGIPHRPILPIQVANQNTGFALSSHSRIQPYNDLRYFAWG